LATHNLTETVCPDAANKLDCLRKADVETLNSAIMLSMSLPIPTAYGPVVDGDIIARKASDQLRDGDFVKIPYIVGTTNDEGTYVAPLGINTEQDVWEILMSSGRVNVSLASQLMSRYSNEDVESVSPGVSNFKFNTTVGLQFKRAATILTDIVFGAPTRYAAQLCHQHSCRGIYIFNANTTISQGPNYLGASHGFELPYVFYNLDGTGWEGDEPPFSGGNPFAGRPQPYLDLAEVMSGMWIGFFNDGIPHYDNREWPYSYLIIL